jgi:hypothetical protein
MKTIVTHTHPDLDAITSTWLVKRFRPDWQDAEIRFVSAGSTLNQDEVDNDPTTIHVDTGLGRFDHHQTAAFTSATKLVFNDLVKNHFVSDTIELALARLVTHVNEIDHFVEVDYPDPTADRYEFFLSQIIEGLHMTLKDEREVVNSAFIMLDAVLQLFIQKIKAEEEIKKGYIFESAWGKSLAMETRNEESMKLALKMQYALVVRKDPERGNIRIKALPKCKKDLSILYEKLTGADMKASWFLHSSKRILLNGSSKGPTMTPTTLPLKTVIEIIKKIE